MEKVELDAEIAAADAKMKVLLNPNVTEFYGDAMNEYFEETSKQVNVDQTFTDTSALEFIQLGAVPKTPLQRAVGDTHKSSQVATRAPNPHLGDPATSYITHENISTMVKSQRDITELMIMQQNLSLLPKREVPVFKGDPLHTNLSCMQSSSLLKGVVRNFGHRA